MRKARKNEGFMLMSGLKIIKFAVFFMTSVLLFGLILCLQIIYEKNHKSSVNFENIDLQQPFDSKIKNIVAGDKDLYIMLEGGGLGERIAVYSPEKQKVLYFINVEQR